MGEGRGKDREEGRRDNKKDSAAGGGGGAASGEAGARASEVEGGSKSHTGRPVAAAAAGSGVPAAGGSLLLNMLVKNEEEHLERSLPRWAALIDYWSATCDPPARICHGRRTLAMTRTISHTGCACDMLASNPCAQAQKAAAHTF